MTDKLVRAVHPNAGVEAAYREALKRAIAEMARSVEYWLTAAYRKRPPRLAALASDASPSEAIERMMRDLADRWIGKFEDWAPKLAERYLKGAFKASDSAFQQALKAAGWSVEFSMTPTLRDVFEASLSENVGLIKSIPEQYLQQVQGEVMRAYSAGRDLESLTRALRLLYPKAADRAELIARDQSNKANAVVNRARSLELGITEAVWMHSHAGKTPRPDHLAANGKKFEIAKGRLIGGRYVQPGEEINCRCTYRVVLPF